MHVPDGFLDTTASIASGAVAVGALAWAARGARDELVAPGSDGTPGSIRGRIALAATVGVTIFGAQMVNFPVLSGTSGHLFGTVLAATILGPRLALLVIASVLGVQATLFADGGLTALGANILLIGVVPLGGYALARRWWHPRTRAGLTARAAAAAAVSVVFAATAFAVLYAVGGTAAASAGAVAAGMLGVHVLIGAGEALVTAVVVGAVLAIAPGAVADARGARVVVAQTADGAGASGRPGWAIGALAGTGLLAAVGLSRLASPHPDGLEFVAEVHGFEALEHAWGTFPLAGYGEAGGIDLTWVGLVGLAATAALIVLVLAGIAVGRDREDAGRSASPA